MEKKDIHHHISKTYRWLRFALVILAISFPVVLFIGGKCHYYSVPLQDSMSAYYHAHTPYKDLSNYGGGAMRNCFVGFLFAIGILLCVYQGATKLEDRALNLAGFCAFGVALFPMDWNNEGGHWKYFHYGFATTLFAAMIYVCWYRASDTLAMLEDTSMRMRYQRCYKCFAIAMGAAISIPIFVRMLVPKFSGYLFWVELGGIYTFAAFWWIKSCEIGRINAQQLSKPKTFITQDYGWKNALGPVVIQPVDHPENKSEAR